MADAFMDLLSSIVMMWAARQASRPNPAKYPAVCTCSLFRAESCDKIPFLTQKILYSLLLQGKARLETAGIMVSCYAINICTRMAPNPMTDTEPIDLLRIYELRCYLPHCKYPSYRDTG